MIQAIENDFLKVAVSLAGAELSSLFNKAKQQEYLWQGNAAWWGRRAPVLFPIVGKVNKNVYRVDGKTYALTQHGFARDQEFEFIGGNGNSLSFRLKSSEETLKKYPYEFELMITYVLEGRSVTLQYDVANPGKSDLYFSIGAHPAFAFKEGEKISDYYITFDQVETLDRHLITDGFLNGETEPVLTNSNTLELNDEQMTKDAIVLKGMTSTRLTLKSHKSDYHVQVDAKGFPYFGIWGKPEGPFVCLEPWYGVADYNTFSGEFSEREGIQKLAPGKQFHCEFKISL